MIDFLFIIIFIFKWLSSGKDSDYTSADSATVMDLRAAGCDDADFIRVSEGCGIEVYDKDGKRSKKFGITVRFGLTWIIAKTTSCMG